jgi:hypothetical protein
VAEEAVAEFVDGDSDCPFLVFSHDHPPQDAEQGPAPKVAPEDASRSDSEEALRETFFIDEAVNKVNTK